MSNLLLNLVLAIIWCILTGDFTPTNFLVGVGLGFLLVGLSQRALEQRPPNVPRSGVRPNYILKLWHIIYFVLFFLWELILSNVRVAYEILTPNFYMTPGVVAIPLDLKSDDEITLLANLITLTPGTLSLDVSDDRRTLYIHAMYIEDDLEVFKAKIKNGLEKRVMEVFS